MKKRHKQRDSVSKSEQIFIEGFSGMEGQDLAEYVQLVTDPFLYFQITSSETSL